VAELAERLGIPLEKVDFDTEGYAEQHKVSIEMAARELRYGWFEKVRKELACDYVAVAHHSDDLVETFLINLSRGAGIHGLSGIKPKNGKIVRPLLSVSRAEVLNYLSEHGLEHVEDSTNAESVYVRNKFRNEIIPKMEEVNPSFKRSVLQAAENLAEAERFVGTAIADVKRGVVSRDGNLLKISMSGLAKSVNARFVLYEILSEFGFSSAVVDDVIKSFETISGKRFYSPKYRLIRDRDSLLVAERGDEDADAEYYIEEYAESLSVPVRAEIRRLSADEFEVKRDKRFCFLDADKLKFPLVLRKWRDGDYFVPFGMKNRKKVSDFFIDRKMSLLEKEAVWLLVSDGDIVWVVGERSDDRFKVDANTKNVIELQIK
jgi:tRNA(Ile)-lysidine synthase